MSELLKALQDIEKLKKTNKLLHTEKETLERENYLIRNDLREKYPFFMFVKLDNLKSSRPITLRHKNNYYGDARYSFEELKELMFRDVYRLLRDIEEQLKEKGDE